MTIRDELLNRRKQFVKTAQDLQKTLQDVQNRINEIDELLIYHQGEVVALEELELSTNVRKC